MRAITSIALGLALAATTFAQDKDKKDDGKPSAFIRVCVAELQNTSRRPVSLPLMRERLLKDLKDSKAPKKAADQRRITAVPLGGEGAPWCDFTLYVTVVELRQKTDPLWQQERNQGIGNVPSPGSRHEEVTYGEVVFKLRRSGSPTPIVQSSVSGEETYDENGTVQLLLDQIARRVNSAVREAPDAMRE